MKSSARAKTFLYKQMIPPPPLGAQGATSQIPRAVSPSDVEPTMAGMNIKRTRKLVNT